MNAQSNIMRREGASALMKLNPAAPAIVVTGRDTASIRAGTEFAGRLFEADSRRDSDGGRCDNAMIKSARHSWGEPVRFQYKTERECARCGLIKVTRHEPAAAHPWLEFWRDGARLKGDGTPACAPARAEVGA